MLRVLAATLVGITLGSCQTLRPARDPEFGVDFRVEVQNNVAEKRFDLLFISMAPIPLCLTPEQWPRESGWLDHQGGPWVWADADGDRFPLREHNMGSCPGCFAAEVQPRQMARAYLPYARFAGLDEVVARQRTLHITPRPVWCE